MVVENISWGNTSVRGEKQEREASEEQLLTSRCSGGFKPLEGEACAGAVSSERSTGHDGMKRRMNCKAPLRLKRKPNMPEAHFGIASGTQMG